MTSQRWAAAVLAACCCAIVACSGSSRTEEKKPEARTDTPSRAPDHYRVKFDTTKGQFVVDVTREWAPKGADRFYKLVRDGYYDGSRFYRVRPKFVVQWGISADPKLNELWKQLKITDDPVKQSNDRSFVSFATDGPNTRTTEVFINLENNKRLDARGFSPFGQVTTGMDVVDGLYAGYGEVQELRGPGVDARQYESGGEAYVARSFPRLDQIKQARITD